MLYRTSRSFPLTRQSIWGVRSMARCEKALGLLIDLKDPVEESFEVLNLEKIFVNYWF